MSKSTIVPEQKGQKLVPPKELIFDNKKMLIALLISQKNTIFERMISSEMIELMIDQFIKTPQEHMNDDEKCAFVRNFLDCLLIDFGVDMIEIKSNKAFAEGANGKVYESNRKTKNCENKELIKISINHEDMQNNLHVFDSNSLNTFHSTIYDYASELFTYIVWIVVLRYISTYENSSRNKRKWSASSSTTNTTEIAEKINYTKYIIKMNKPFIAICTEFDESDNENEIFESLCKPSQTHAERHNVSFRDNIRLKFCIGYYMKRHDRSLDDLLQKPDRIIDYPLIGTMMKKVFAILHTFNKFSNLGIDLMHRDITPKNIVVDDNGDVTIIDFGTALIGIKFQDNMSWTHGTYFKEEYTRTIQMNFDTVLFMMMMVRCYERQLFKLRLIDYFEKTIGYDQATKKRHDKNDELLWLHPYLTPIHEAQNQDLPHDVIKYL
jgi:serine/threonine protein kinase